MSNNAQQYFRNHIIDRVNLNAPNISEMYYTTANHIGGLGPCLLCKCFKSSEITLVEKESPPYNFIGLFVEITRRKENSAR